MSNRVKNHTIPYHLGSYEDSLSVRLDDWVFRQNKGDIYWHSLAWKELVRVGGRENHDSVGKSNDKNYCDYRM